MNIRENAIGRSYRSFSDVVEKVVSSKFYNKPSPFYGRRFWIIHCKKNKFNVFDEYFDDKDFINKIENSEIFEKKFKFVVLLKGNYLIKVEEVKGDNDKV